MSGTGVPDYFTLAADLAREGAQRVLRADIPLDRVGRECADLAAVVNARPIQVGPTDPRIPRGAHVLSLIHHGRLVDVARFWLQGRLLLWTLIHDRNLQHSARADLDTRSA